MITADKAKLAAKVGAVAALLVVPLVQMYEGTVLHGYRDPIGIVTACTGHTGADAQMRAYTPAECEALLYRDLLDHAEALDCIKVPLAPHQRAAFLSFSFNVGTGAFCASTLVAPRPAGRASLKVEECVDDDHAVWLHPGLLAGLR